MQEMKIGPPNGREHLLRQQSGQKMKLKEKFVEIYDMFLRGQDPSIANGKDPDVFWDELFLIKVNADYLSSSLRETTEDQLLAIKDGINSIFLHAVQTMRDPLPQRRLHAMQTLTIVLGEIFRKKFHNWSFDVIHLLTGLSHADLVFRTLVQGLAQILDSEESMELRVVALRLAIALVCGNDNVNKNSLNEYFMQKDIFSSVAKFFMAVDSADLAFEALALLGLLANYNKYETQNPYLAQLTALNDETILRKMALVITVSCDKMRRSYIAVADDDELSTVSKVTSAFSYVTGMLWNPKSQDSSVTDAAFAELPDGRATILMVMYDLLYMNRPFRRIFLSFSTTTSALAQLQFSDKLPDPSADVNGKGDKETGLAIYLSFASYLFQHNRTQRTSPYTHLCLITLLILVEDPTLYPCICSIPQSQDASPAIHGQVSETSVRLCRQRQPVLPKVKQARPLGAVLLDVILGFLKHNMKKKMQIDSFRIAISIIISLASRFKSLRVRLSYHWVEMWNTLLGLVKFLHANIKVFQHQPEARDLVAEVIDLVNYFVTYGDLIMPDPASLYALYYEIVRSGIDVFSELAKEFTISIQPPLPAPLPHHDLTSRNRLNLASTPAPASASSPPESTIGSPLPAFSHLSSPPASPYHPYSRTGSPGPNKAQRNIIIDLSNINQVHTFFFTHLLAWRDANPTRSLGPDLVSTIIKTHYQDLALVSISLDTSLTLKQNQGGLGGKGANSTAVVSGSGPHPGWDAYTEVPSKVYFFRQLTRWIVADFRSISYDKTKLPLA
ncbi:hypothetical protein MVEG_02559 [Podila verticillata NRRL 6337]|nr:hypothetical protein MVEG_02559 [Podila verticillata NRRL 6337]